MSAAAGVVCRPAAQRDLEALARLRWRLKAEDSTLNERDFDAFLQDFIAASHEGEDRGDMVHWLAEQAGDIIAAMTVIIVRKTPSPAKIRGRWGYLTNCFTKAEARDAGVGSALLTTIKQWARDEGLEFLAVWPSDRAFKFYERAGFERLNDPLVLDLE